MQITTTMSSHLTSVKMPIINKSTNTKCWRGYREKVTLLSCWWECKLIQPLWRNIWRFLKKLKIKLQYDPAVLLLGTFPAKTKIQKDTCTPGLTAVLFTIDMEAIPMSINKRMGKEDVAHTYDGGSLSHKKEQNSVICRDVDWSRDCHTEWSKSEEEK